ncbi:glycosyltransferase family 4 protein [Lactobacillus delbrueckii]|uniref:glycosyltransferase family 4 protein n=1 Tax=Lactobacillus delbrueckii TaxID=1584 RepID=UPI001F24BD22|nr:glycosyltransferase family 4 protein [Lactobacillus delbrueckii]GHN54733.1 glycosyltransferase [Lactobacillus delbrueckii]GHN58707.1 glycosyltransferase [Lactobacillus delbrueckii]
MDLAEQNILFIARAPIHGGTENVVLQLCETFKPLVNKIIVCAGKGFDKGALKEMQIKFYEIPDLADKSPKTMLDISFKLRQIVKSENITVIHTHHRMAAFYVTLLELYKKCIFINTSHNTFYDKTKFTRFSYNHAHLIACGEKVKENLTDEYGLKDVTVIHNAVKPFSGLVVLEPSLKKWHDLGYYLIGNVGRLTEQKGIKYFIGAMPEILRKYPKTKFIIIGAGELEQKLEQQAKDGGVWDAIVWLGFRNDIQNLMSQLDLVVLSSLWEGLPLTPIEAFSVGVPVVGTAVDGTPEEIRDGYNGYLAKPKDSKDLAEKIITYLNQNTRKPLRDAAKKTYNKEFSFKVLKNSYVSFYESI